MAANIYDWSLVAANNSNADGDLTWAEGQAPSTVNNSARVVMQRVKQLLVDIGGSIAAGGTANGLTVTANAAFTAYADGMIISFRATASNSAAATLNVNGIGAKAIRKMGTAADVALAGGDITNTGIYIVQYSAALNGAAGAWLLVNPTLSPSPVGGIMDYAGSTAPSLWLMCFGQAVSRATYAALFAVISTTYGVGDGSTTFNLPDLRGRVSAGKDDMGGSSANRLTGLTGGVDGDVLGAVGGEEAHAMLLAENAAHTHTGTTGNGSANHSHGGGVGSTSDVAGSAQTSIQGGVANGGTVATTAASGSAHTHSFTTASSGSGAAHNTVQPTIILNKIIYAGA